MSFEPATDIEDVIRFRPLKYILNDNIKWYQRHIDVWYLFTKDYTLITNDMNVVLKEINKEQNNDLTTKSIIIELNKEKWISCDEYDICCDRITRKNFKKLLKKV